MVSFRQATILIKETCTPPVTSIVTDVVVSNSKPKPFFHVRFHFEIPTKIEEFGGDGELHGINPDDPYKITPPDPSVCPSVPLLELS